ncbi:MAG TPA: AAA family ATPase, partial [Acidimicrobiales bacterium]|nr:AAA family ATPase [Acidimicrobiales bacterium]
MLAELHVANLGVIADLRLTLDAGMTALTGETGAGKTLLVEAIELLVGGRADAVLVRPGAEEAFVEGRFVTTDGEVILARAVPAGGGRSRAYVDGRMAPVASLAEAGRALVDLHGQHAHQSLLSVAVQRRALDVFAGADRAPLEAARARIREIDGALDALGGDARARAREIDLLRFQVDEIEAARLQGDDEDEMLAAEEERLAGAADTRAAAGAAHDALVDAGGAADGIGSALGAAAGHGPLVALAERLRGLQAEVADVAAELRNVAESLEDDPERLAEIQARRQALRELRRKYGDTLAEVVRFRDEASQRLA